MTDEELDRARVREALRVAETPYYVELVAGHAARLAREGWKPVDPDLLEAQAITEKVNHDINAGVGIAESSRGDILKCEVEAALRGIARGRELEREGK